MITKMARPSTLGRTTRLRTGLSGSLRPGPALFLLICQAVMMMMIFSILRQMAHQIFFRYAKPCSEKDKRWKTRRGRKRGTLKQSTVLPIPPPASTADAQLHQPDTVMNLSDTTLSKDCVSAPSKGLSFAPTYSANQFQTKIDVFKFYRNIPWNVWYKQSPYNIIKYKMPFLNLFSNPSPPFSQSTTTLALMSLPKKCLRMKIN